MLPSPDVCRTAVLSKDPRFDGVFFTAVTSTEIFCRPSCPAMTPKVENQTYYPSAAAAIEAGFRACRRCRPDTTPGSPEWDTRGDTAARALQLLADGAIDRDGVTGLAARIGYSPRQLERILRSELGASPLALARAQRASTARILIETTDIPFTEVAFAAGFGSIRSFNDTVRATFAATPTELRSRRTSRRTPVPPSSTPSELPLGSTTTTPLTSTSASPTHALTSAATSPAHALTLTSPSPTPPITVRLATRTPYAPVQSFAHLIATAIPGIEEWDGTHYRRTLRLPHGSGVVAVAPREDHVEATFTLTDLRDLQAAVTRTRRMLDLDADPIAVADHLARDPRLAPHIAATPGRRVPRTADPEEMALRVVLGQQISTAAARTHAARLVERLGDPLPIPDPTLTHLFPTSDTVAGAELTGLPAGRADTLRELAGALASGSIDVGPGTDRDAAREALAELPGIGPWTVELTLMRAIGSPDAFPATDLGVSRGAANLGVATDGRALIAAAERWRPWRSYAVQYLWAAHEHSTNVMPVPHTDEGESAHEAPSL